MLWEIMEKCRAAPENKKFGWGTCGEGGIVITFFFMGAWLVYLFSIREIELCIV